MSHMLLTLLGSIVVLLVIVSPLLVLVIRYNGKRGQFRDTSSTKKTPPDKGNTPPDPGASDDGD